MEPLIVKYISQYKSKLIQGNEYKACYWDKFNDVPVDTPTFEREGVTITSAIHIIDFEEEDPNNSYSAKSFEIVKEVPIEPPVPKPVIHYDNMMNAIEYFKTRPEELSNGIKECDIKTGDILHYLELNESLSQSVEHGIIQKLVKIRRHRRELKNEQELINGFNYTCNSHEMKQLLPKLKNNKIDVDKILEKQSKRQYTNRTEWWKE